MQSKSPAHCTYWSFGMSQAYSVRLLTVLAHNNGDAVSGVKLVNGDLESITRDDTSH